MNDKPGHGWRIRTSLTHLAYDPMLQGQTRPFWAATRWIFFWAAGEPSGR
jgi:hypothetical protein